jgi:ubiquinone/menaquinone biosynthesis C-methylase UbiE
MDTAESNRSFKLMTLSYKLRDLRLPRRKILAEVDIRPGFSVLDFGCGPGGYIRPLADLVGGFGEVHALDIHPLAVARVERIATKKHLSNVETILSRCETGLDSGSMDAVLLYDIFHHLSDREGVLQELHRVLIPGGILSFSDHHMKERDIVAEVTIGGLFRPVRRGRRTYTFSRELPAVAQLESPATSRSAF